MGNETKKSFNRRLKNGDFERYFKGQGIDIGCGAEAVLPSALKHDKIYGDCASNLKAWSDETFDYVYSSHCFEHISGALIFQTLQEWWRVLKKGGHLIIVVPDFTLYEKKQWPSQFNSDHKMFYRIESMMALFSFLPMAQLIRLQLNDEGFDYSDKVTDQTRRGAQSEIEMIVRKVSDPFWAANIKRADANDF
jgi:predicted SAM-dependent methyltransferase